VETNFGRQARELVLSSPQRELVVGSLLGDAYLMPTTAGYCFRVNHGLHQRTSLIGSTASWSNSYERHHAKLIAAITSVLSPIRISGPSGLRFTANRARRPSQSSSCGVSLGHSVWRSGSWMMVLGKDCSFASTPSRFHTWRASGWRSFCELNSALARH
jgi:hypothetical protein